MTILTPISDKVGDVAEAALQRKVQHGAGEELLCEVINMLAFMQLCGEHRDGDEFAMDGKAVSDMAGVIIERVIRARKHFRESL